MSEQRVGEEMVVADVTVRFLEREVDGWFFAAGSPVADEWVYLADADSLEDLEDAARIILETEASRGVFVRMAALLGVPWNEGDMVRLLVEQEKGARRLAEKAPGTADADPEELRRMRKETAGE